MGAGHLLPGGQLVVAYSERGKDEQRGDEDHPGGTRNPGVDPSVCAPSWACASADLAWSNVIAPV